MTIRGKETSSDKKIVFPIFKECSQFTLDPYWQQVFEDCSRGRFPRGCGIDQDGKTIFFKGRNSSQGVNSYKLGDDPQVIFKDLKQLFQEQLNLRSTRDRLEIRAELDDICKDIQKTFTGTWQKIKRKKIKDPIIRRFILDLKERYSLTDKETAEVAQIIRLGFLFNWIDNEHVEYTDQKIIDITILHFNPDERTFELDDPGTCFKREYKPKFARLSSLWEKYLEKLGGVG